MITTKIQLPEDLYREAKRVARERDISVAEVMRRGLEYIVRVYPAVAPNPPAWTPPTPSALGPFQTPVEQWRLLANTPPDDTLL